MFGNEELVELHLEVCFQESHGPLVVVHGGATGADAIANAWAFAQRAAGREVYVECYPAEWAKYGKAAGPIRNQKMLMETSPDLVLAFPGGKGTADMVARAKCCEIPVRQVQDPQPTTAST